MMDTRVVDHNTRVREGSRARGRPQKTKSESKSLDEESVGMFHVFKAVDAASVKEARAKRKKEDVTSEEDEGEDSQPPAKAAKTPDGGKHRGLLPGDEQLPLYGVEEGTARGPFSADELKVVQEAVEELSVELGIDRAEFNRRLWSKSRTFIGSVYTLIRQRLPWRTAQSIRQHVKRQYNPFEQRGQWTAGEDAQLKELYKLAPGQWRSIGDALGRMGEDCRDRWRNYLVGAEARRSAKWDASEDEALRRVVREMLAKEGSINWTLVSERLHGVRSRVQCRNHYAALSKSLHV